ncbi:heparinase II/III family protein [Sphingomonas flavalba]|uniref:heparinase II/III family protein n=1 Tax=Sphingomonas flavalba TaxID=2559804 RepID=UPI0039E08A08
MSKAVPIDPAADGIEEGKRLIRLDGEKGLSLAERIANSFNRLTWRTPLHSFRLRGRFPLKLLAVPSDPIIGDQRAGQALLDRRILFGGEAIPVPALNFATLAAAPGLVTHLHSFAWLRDLSTVATRQQGAPIAEAIMRKWLAAHADNVGGIAWRYDIVGRRILFWAAHAPLILSSNDIVYRSTVLNALARFARHVERGADRAPPGLARVAAWAGVVAAGLLIPGGSLRRQFGEEGLTRALGAAFYDDGGTIDRSPSALLDGIALLALLRAVYEARREQAPLAIHTVLSRAVPALLGVTHGDGGLASWQGGLPVDAQRVAAIIEASGVRARPLRQARDWGYQRLAGGATVISVDAAPPPVSRLAEGGCASTLAFELSDGPHRVIVNCGGARHPGLTIPPALADGLRTSAAHSTLVLGDTNSTAVHTDGSLGRGVAEVEIDRQETEAGSRLEASHDGYLRKFGLLHRRLIMLSADGREVRGEDILLPGGRRRSSRAARFAVRFHLAPGIEVTPTADGLGALLRIPDGALWQFRAKGAQLASEESLWVDPRGRPVETVQLVMSGESPAGGTSVSWILRRAG